MGGLNRELVMRWRWSVLGVLFIASTIVVSSYDHHQDVVSVSSNTPTPPSPSASLCSEAVGDKIPCEPRDVSGIDLISGSLNSESAFSSGSASTVEELLELGLLLTGASPVHLAVRGTTDGASIRCDWRGIARTPDQREDTLRFWLELTDEDAIPNATYLESLFTATLDLINPHVRETAKSNFRSIAEGGLSTDYLFLACYADHTAREYLLGTGDGTITVAYDRLDEAHSYELYTREHADGTFPGDLQSQGEYESGLLELVSSAETALAERIGDSESVLFLAPMGAHNAIAVEAWQVVEQWDLQMDDDDVVHAVRYGVPEGDPESSQTLANLTSRITAATTGDATDDLITNASGLTQYYRDIGAYGDITPDDGSTDTFTPAQPPPAPDCANGTAVSDPSASRGLVYDCEALLASKGTLRGSATLDWVATTSIDDWEGITTGGAPTQVTGLELSGESLTGTIPPELGTIFELTTLDLSSNSLTGDIPSELGWLHNLEEIRLTGNTLSGCIPVALEQVSTNDLSTLGLLYCHPPAPGNLTVSTADETSISVTWDAVSNTSKYRVEYRPAASSDWIVDDDTLTTTTHTVDELECGRDYRFRVSAYGSGTNYAAEWSDPSQALTASTAECILPVFDAASYSFSVMGDAALDTVVGSILATADSGEPVTYSITAGNEEGFFTIGEGSGIITVTGDLTAGIGTTVTLMVTANDPDPAGGEATVEVSIEITDTCDSGTAVPNPTSNLGLVSDCETLLVLKSALAGTGRLNWSADLAMSEWRGISISDAPRRVIGVKLQSSGLGGIIPAVLGELTGLQDLWLDRNQLTGEIPAELGNLTSLYSLYLDQNQLTGEIPAELGNLSVLEDLFLYNNQLTGSIPPEVASLEELRQLWITNNQLSGVLPGELAGLDEAVYPEAKWQQL